MNRTNALAFLNFKANISKVIDEAQTEEKLWWLYPGILVSLSGADLELLSQLPSVEQFSTAHFNPQSRIIIPPLLYSHKLLPINCLTALQLIFYVTQWNSSRETDDGKHEVIPISKVNSICLTDGWSAIIISFSECRLPAICWMPVPSSPWDPLSLSLMQLKITRQG